MTDRTRLDGLDATRVALVGSTYPPVMGGVEAYNQRAAHGLAGAGCAVTVATRFAHERAPGGMAGLLSRYEPAGRFRDATLEADEAGAVDVHVLTPRPAWLLRPVYRLHFRAPALAARLVALAHRAGLAEALAGADVVHYSGTGRELLGFAALRQARRQRVPFVVTPHLHAGAWGDGPLDLALYRQADAVVALTEVEKAHLVAKGVAPERVHVVGHGVSVDGTGDGGRFRAEHGLGEAPVVLYLARKAVYKGYRRLLDAAEAVWARVPEARFVVAGPPDDALAGPPHPALADPRVLDLGPLTDSAREDAYAASTVFCVPSEAEAFGLVYLEAWRYEVPVVALSIPTLDELIGPSGGGVLVKDQPGALADALARLLVDAPRRARIGEAGSARAAEATWARVAERLLGVYRAAGAALPAPREATAGPAALALA